MGCSAALGTVAHTQRAGAGAALQVSCAGQALRHVSHSQHQPHCKHACHTLKTPISMMIFMLASHHFNRREFTPLPHLPHTHLTCGLADQRDAQVLQQSHVA